MARQAVKARPPWEDRWNEPDLKPMLEPLSEMHRKPFESLIAALDAYELVERSMVWHGVSWKWTLHYQMFTDQAKPMGTLCYLVPNPETPLICIPMTTEQIHALPFKRLNRVIRDGIASAKCAIETHWAIWTPTSQSDVNHIMDLIKRIHKMAYASGNGKK